MSENNKTVTVSFPILGMLGILFVGLKLAGVINWSWFWITFPFWMGPAAVFLIVVGALMLAAIIQAFDNMQHRRVQRRKLEKRKKY